MSKNATQANIADGLHSMVPPEKMAPSAKKLRDTYAMTPGAPLFQGEHGYYCLEEWYEQGLDREADLAEVFDYDDPGNHFILGTGWCEPAFVPIFETKIIEDRGEHELVQDFAGRQVLYFKGRRDGFMPEYLDHPVKDMKAWKDKCKWRLDPKCPERFKVLEQTMPPAREAAEKGLMITQVLVGGYMYLRSLFGPTEVMYAFYDMPEVIHDCMQSWLEMAKAAIARHQEYLTLDEILFAEDICYNHGPLVSPEIMKEFIFPYYQQLMPGARQGQIDKERHLFVQLDSDGWCVPVISLYQEHIGMDVMSPFEVASGCDVVEIGKKYPKLVMSGGIDKRILAKTKSAIDEHLERIIPAMRKRGGYIPTCDHGVPAEVTLDNYLYYRKRSVELGG